VVGAAPPVFGLRVDLDVEISPSTADVLVDGYGDPFGGDAYVVTGQDAFMDVTMLLPTTVPIDHIRSSPVRGSGLSLRVVFWSIRARPQAGRGNWWPRMINKTPLSQWRWITPKVLMGGKAPTYLRLIMHSPLNDQAVLRVEEVEVPVPKIQIRPHDPGHRRPRLRRRRH
jgi:hypothetical protein